MAQADCTPEIENWMPVVAYEGVYEVSDLGRVRRLPGNKWSYVPMLSPWKNKYGYRQVTLARKPKRYHPYVHLLVWQAFVGPIPKGMEVNHKDLNKENNRLDNLEVLTKLQNIQHAFRGGACKPQRGELNNLAKLTAEQVREIRSLRGSERMSKAGPLSTVAIGKRYGVGADTIWLILKRKTWVDV